MEPQDTTLNTVSAPSKDENSQVTILKSDLEKVKKMILKAKAEIKEADMMLDILMNKKSYKEIAGIEGIFDGERMREDNGTYHDVPANYAAKSRLVCGDRLKKVEEEGKTIFKQIEKVDRKMVDGVVSKKEGKWYVLTEVGSYEIAERAAEFNNLAINDKVRVVVPEKNLSAPFAALEKVLTPKPDHSRIVHREEPRREVAPVAQVAVPVRAPARAVAPRTNAPVASAPRPSLNNAAPSASRSRTPATFSGTPASSAGRSRRPAAPRSAEPVAPTAPVFNRTEPKPLMPTNTPTALPTSGADDDDLR